MIVMHVKKIIALFLIATLSFGLTAHAAAASDAPQGFDDYGGYSDTKTEYSFLIDNSVLVYGGEAEEDFTYLDEFYAGSAMYVPVGAYNTEGKGADEKIATDKQIKNDKVELSYKVINGASCVETVELVSGKKEKIKDLPAGMYAKIKYTGDYLELGRTTVKVRLVLSVGGISYQDTAVTFSCKLMNRKEDITKNSVYGAITPAQFKVASNYWGEATFDFGGNIRYTARVKAREVYYLNLDQTPDAAITEMYPDAYLLSLIHI